LRNLLLSKDRTAVFPKTLRKFIGDESHNFSHPIFNFLFYHPQKCRTLLVIAFTIVTALINFTGPERTALDLINRPDILWEYRHH
jgi:hypothetical protein